MAVDMFIKLKGVDGESMDDKHKKEIDVLSWSWSASQSGTTHTGGGGGGGKVNVNDLSFTKYIDSSSHTLYQRVFDGKPITEGSLAVRKAGGTPLDYLTIKMTNIIVTSISTGGSGGEDRLTEHVSLNFSKVEVDYIPQKEDGTGEAAKKAGWDIAASKTAV